MCECEVESKPLQQKKPDETEIKLYKRRWIIITIFIFYAAINAAQWIEYAIVSNVIVKYYGVSSYLVEWTSIMFMACYAPLIVPASYIVNKMGLRAASLFGGLGTTIGTVIKVFSVHPDRFWLVLCGQFLVACSQTVIIGLPPKIACIWFGAKEISTASALAVFGTQLGTGIGFFIPGLVVHNRDNLEDIGKDIYIMCWIFAGIMIPVGLAVLFYFPNLPPNPPNQAQVVERSKEGDFNTLQFLKDFGKLIINPGYLMHMISYGINVACYSAIATLLNQYVLEYFPGRDKDAGMMGTLQVIVGMIGSVLFGIFLDKTHRFKESCVFIATMSCISVVAFLLALHWKMMIWAYVFCGFFGFFFNACWSVGFEMATELTYPISEMTATGVILATSQILGVILTIFASWILQKYGSFWSMVSQIALLAIGIICSLLTPNKLKRQAALRVNTSNGVLQTVSVKSPDGKL